MPVPCVASSFAGCELAVWTAAFSAGTVLQRAPVAPNEDQKVPCWG